MNKFLTTYILFFLIKTAYLNGCKLIGSVVVFVNDGLRIRVECTTPFHISHAGFINQFGTHYSLFKNKTSHLNEEVSFFNRYLLNFSKNELELMDIDSNLKNFRIYFCITRVGKAEIFISTERLQIIYLQNSPVSIEKRLEARRIFTNVYTLGFKHNIINWRLLENKFKLFFTQICICFSKENQCRSVEITKLTNYLYNEFLFLIEINDHIINIIKYTGNLECLTILFTFISKESFKVVSLRKFLVESPLKIIEISPNYIKWNLKDIFVSYIRIIYLLPMGENRLNVGECVKKNQEIVCERKKGLSNIFGDLTNEGIELTNKGVFKSYIKIYYDINQFLTVNEYCYDIFFELTSRTVSDKNIFEAQNIKKPMIFFNKTVAKSDGILNFTVISDKTIKDDYFLNSRFSIKKDNIVYKICKKSVFGTFEYVNLFTKNLLACDYTYVAFFDITESFFSNLKIVYMLNKREYKLLNVIYKSIFSDLNHKKQVDQRILIENGRKLYYTPILHLGKDNEINFDKSDDMYAVSQFGICYDSYLCKFQTAGSENPTLNLAGCILKLQNRKLQIYGKIGVINSAYILIVLTNGMDEIVQSTKSIYIEKNVFLPISCSSHYISWEITIKSLNFVIFLVVENNFVLIGECVDYDMCIAEDNKYVERLNYTHMFFKTHANLSKFLFLIKIYIINKMVVNDYIEFQKFYDLESEEYFKQGIKTLIQLGTNQSVTKLGDDSNQLSTKKSELNYQASTNKKIILVVSFIFLIVVMINMLIIILRIDCRKEYKTINLQVQYLQNEIKSENAI